MIFFKLWRHDLRYGLSKRLLLYLLVAFGQAFLFCRGFSNWIGNMSGLPEIGELSDTFGNYMIYLFQGMDEYVATPDKAFEFPAMWILIFLCGNALTLTYPLRDLEGVGQQLLIRSGRRRHWWLAKCGWEIVSSVVYLLLLWLGVLCYCAIFQIPITLEINEWLVSVMASWEITSPLNPGEVWLWLIAGPMLFMILLNLVELAVGLLLGTIWGFTADCVILLLSAYWMNPWLPGNYVMFLRSRWLIPETGLALSHGIWLMLAGSLCMILIGGIFFSRKDILRKE